MSKFDGRTKGSALAQLDQSLQRLGTDHLDLWQFHDYIRLEDPDRFFAEVGAHRSAEMAQPIVRETSPFPRIFPNVPDGVDAEGYNMVETKNDPPEIADSISVTVLK